MESKPEALAGRLPDISRWVEPRSMLLSGRCAIVGGKPEDGYVVRGSDMPLICVVGHPGPEAIRQSVSLVSGPIEILSPPESADEVARALPGRFGTSRLRHWRRTGAAAWLTTT